MQAATDLATAPLPSDPVAIIDEIRALEDLVCAAQARQGRLAAALDRQRQAAHRAAMDVAGSDLAARPAPPATASEVALARRVSPHRGRRLLSLARFLSTEMPRVSAAFDAGRISEWRASLIAREVSCLDAEQRDEVDRLLAEDPDHVASLGDRRLVGFCREQASRLDAAAVAKRRLRAESARTVTVRPAPDSMAYLTVLLPAAQAIATYGRLRAHARDAVGTGAASGLGQAMADELVRRVAGLTDTSVESGKPVVPVTLRLTMPVDALLDGAHDAAQLDGFGPIPAGLARELVADNLDAGLEVWIKRLYTRPETGALISMDARSRRFPSALAEFIELRDRWCRTLYCDAPIRHLDHIRRHADGGPTSAGNGEGACESCNYVKEATAWRLRQVEGPRHTIEIVTPTFHLYYSRAPAA